MKTQRVAVELLKINYSNTNFFLGIDNSISAECLLLTLGVATKQKLKNKL